MTRPDASCRSLRLRLAAYADDELGVEGAVEVESHLAQCAACRSEVERQRAFTRALRDLYPSPPEPRELADRIRWTVFGRRGRRLTAIVGALAASLVMIIGAAALLFRGDGGPPAALVAAARFHEIVGSGELPLDIRSRHLTAVNDWLHTELPFAGELPDPGSAAVAVEGAARVSLAGEPAGLVRYHVGGRAVSLFLLARPLWAEEGQRIHLRGIDFRVLHVGGQSVVAWSHSPLSYLLVSEGGVPRGEACAVCHGGGSGLPPIAGFAQGIVEGPAREAGTILEKERT